MKEKKPLDLTAKFTAYNVFSGKEGNNVTSIMPTEKYIPPIFLFGKK
jgi:hypothetical protein